MWIVLKLVFVYKRGHWECTSGEANPYRVAAGKTGISTTCHQIELSALSPWYVLKPFGPWKFVLTTDGQIEAISSSWGNTRPVGEGLSFCKVGAELRVVHWSASIGRNYSEPLVPTFRLLLYSYPTDKLHSKNTHEPPTDKLHLKNTHEPPSAVVHWC